MKSSLKAKLIQHLAAKKGNAGFTLIELLVVIIIIGILSAIALPSFLNQANKAKQSEAKTYIGSLNRAQQAFYLENDEFQLGDAAINSAANQDAIGELGIGVKPVTEYYGYVIQGPDANNVTNQAQPVDNAGALDPTSSLKAYIGGVAIGVQQGTGEATTLAVLCEGDDAPIEGGVTGVEQVGYGDIATDQDAACAENGAYEPVN